MLSNKVILTETTLEDKATIELLFNVAKEDQEYKHIWNLSDNSIAWGNCHSFRKYLSKDFGQYHLYIAHYDDLMLGVFGMLNLSDCVGCANILVWIDKSVRRNIFSIKWFVLFLKEAQKRKVSYWYAKIKLSNTVSLNSAMRFGFSHCKRIPQHLVCNNNKERLKVRCVSRNTHFNDFEKRYIDRYF